VRKEFTMAVMHSLYRQGGTVSIDEASCNQCGLCANICPTETLAMEDGRVHVRKSRFECVACGHCMMTCPKGSISITGRGMVDGDLIPLPLPERCASADALEALMLSRRSIRRFTNQPVDSADLSRIVDMAATAPMGIPPWDVGCVIVSGRDKVRDLADRVVKGYEGFLRIFRPWVLALLRPFSGRAKYEQFRNFIRPLAEEYVEGWRTGHDRVFYDAPAVLIFHCSPYADVLDAAIACTYAMLAAESLGLGTTMIGGAPPILQRDRQMSRQLGIPLGSKATMALIVGHPATHFRHAIRRRFSSVTTD
jgi:nitroreductase/NAD-dependent dihydropyrimidine dehydrogenase PreA subunit